MARQFEVTWVEGGAGYVCIQWLERRADMPFAPFGCLIFSVDSGRLTMDAESMDDESVAAILAALARAERVG